MDEIKQPPFFRLPYSPSQESVKSMEELRNRKLKIRKELLLPYKEPVLNMTIVSHENKKSYDLELMIDTGSYHCVMLESVLLEMGLKKTEENIVFAKRADGTDWIGNAYDCQFVIYEGQDGFSIGGRGRFFGISSSMGYYQGLIGTELLNQLKLKFTYSPSENYFELFQL